MPPSKKLKIRLNANKLKIKLNAKKDEGGFMRKKTKKTKTA